MNAIINNIKNGNLFSKTERFENELLIDVYKPADTLNGYNVSFTTTPFRKSIVLYFNRALMAYKQTHQLN